VHELRLKLHIIFEEKVPGALKEVWRIIHCHNLSVLGLRLVAPICFKAKTFVGNHVIYRGNNMQASIVACAKNLTKKLALVLPRMKL
jgi:hypothetical protein